jgi:hypothetical protein
MTWGGGAYKISGDAGVVSVVIVSGSVDCVERKERESVIGTQKIYPD